MASLRKRLQNLFSTNVVVRKFGKDKLRVVDTNRLQSTGNLAATKITDRYSRLHGSNRHGYGSYGSAFGGYDSNYSSQQNRKQLYTDYEMISFRQKNGIFAATAMCSAVLSGIWKNSLTVHTQIVLKPWGPGEGTQSDF